MISVFFFSGKNNGWFILMKPLEFVKVERPNAMGIDLHVREIPMIHGMPWRKPLWLVKLGDGIFLYLVRFFPNFSKQHGNAVRYLRNDFTWDERKFFFFACCSNEPVNFKWSKSPKTGCWCKLWIVFLLLFFGRSQGCHWFSSSWYRIEVRNFKTNWWKFIEIHILQPSCLLKKYPSIFARISL